MLLVSVGRREKRAAGLTAALWVKPPADRSMLSGVSLRSPTMQRKVTICLKRKSYQRDLKTQSFAAVSPQRCCRLLLAELQITLPIKCCIVSFLNATVPN